MKPTILCFLILLSFLSYSQNENNSKEDRSQFQQGSHTIHLGVGFPNKFNTKVEAVSGIGSILGINEISELDNNKASPQINIGYEYGVSEEIGIGVYLGYFKGESNTLSGAATLIDDILCELTGICPTQEVNYNFEYHVFSVGGRLAVHQKLFDGIDTYASTYAGYNIHSESTKGSFGSQITHALEVPPFSYFVNGGLQFHISNEMGIYAEAGYGLTIVNIGLSYFPK